MAPATYVLIPGAGSTPWYWHLVAPQLRERGHEVLTPYLPVADESAGLTEYADAIVAEIGDRTDVILVAQSMGAFCAPLVCDRVPVSLLVLLCPMIPAPGESASDWWAATGQDDAQRELDVREGRDPDGEFDPIATFLHDVPAEIVAEAMTGVRDQADLPFEQPWPLAAWPDVPIRVLAGTRDRLFPLEFMRRVARERLGLAVDMIDSGHCPALSRPDELVEWLERYSRDLTPATGFTGRSKSSHAR